MGKNSNVDRHSSLVYVWRMGYAMCASLNLHGGCIPCMAKVDHAKHFIHCFALISLVVNRHKLYKIFC